MSRARGGTVASVSETRTEHDSHGRDRGPRRRAVAGADPAGGRELPDLRHHARAPARSRRWPGSRRRPRRSTRDLGVLDREQADGDRGPRPTRSSAASTTTQFPSTSSRPAPAPARNMNMNEVLASLRRRAPAPTCTPTTTSTPASRSNDTFPTAIHVAATLAVVDDLLPALDHLADGAGGQGRRVRRRREVRAHAPDGRHAGDARPGVRRLRRARAARHRAARGGAPAGRASCRWAAPPSAPASTPRPASPRA